MTTAAGAGRFSLIGGLNNPEDLILLEGTDWVVASNMGERGWARGGFYLIDCKTRRPAALAPDFSAPARAPFQGCEPPDAGLFSAHGISVRTLGDRRFNVYAVNHGGRRSVEAFELDARPSSPVLQWLGGVTLPDNQSGNAVAHLPGDGFVVTVTIDRQDPQALAKAVAGQPCGFILEWAPGVGWSSVPGGEVSGDNGVVASDDGAWLYVAAYCEGALYKLSRGRLPYERRRVALNFLADNVRFSPAGKLLVTGHPATTFEAVIDINRGALATASVPTAVAVVDPQTLASRLLLIEQDTPDFGGGTSAIVVGDELWIGAFRSQTIATIALSALGDPEL